MGIEDEVGKLKHKVFWEARVYDGKEVTVYREGEGDYIHKDGDILPWARFRKFLGEHPEMKIVSFGLNAPNGVHHSLVGMRFNPKGRFFDVAEKPHDYEIIYFHGVPEKFDVKHYYGQDRGSLTGELEGKPDWYTIGIGIYKDFELQVWINENDPKDNWSMIAKRR